MTVYGRAHGDKLSKEKLDINNVKTIFLEFVSLSLLLRNFKYMLTIILLEEVSL